jgi:succinoglycan biosynthesis protein ExoM
MKVVVTVCTRERPKMLRACLEAITAQKLPKELSLAIVVIENDEFPRAAPLVSELSQLSGIPIHYAHEPRLGIPIARNCALEIALKHCPDWIGFIDDDETAGPNWLANFFEAANSLDCDVLQGPVESLYPELPPSWMKTAGRRHQPTGRELRTAATSNTFMRARVVCPEGLALRFNEAMRFTGGSDNEFFFRAADLGARICWSDDTLVYENVPRIRLTLRWQLSRAMRVASNTVSMQKRRLGGVAAAGKCIPKYIGRLARGLLMAPVTAPIAILLGAPGKRLFASSLGDLASAIGGLGAYCGLEPQPYRFVDKHPTWGVWLARDPLRRSARLDSARQN